MNTEPVKRRTINVSQKTHDALKQEGMMGETFEDVIKRLLFKKRTGAKDQTEIEKKIERVI